MAFSSTSQTTLLLLCPPQKAWLGFFPTFCALIRNQTLVGSVAPPQWTLTQHTLPTEPMRLLNLKTFLGPKMTKKQETALSQFQIGKEEF